MAEAETSEKQSGCHKEQKDSAGNQDASQPATKPGPATLGFRAGVLLGI
jgi:hypothetical protein